MLNRQHSAGFTLVEMLVALAVGTIIVSGSYASYVLVANQYEKIRDVADMHTSGRAIMRIIERDVRMAGFVWRDNKINKIYGDISEPLKIVDSGNKCCDEITVIYDYHNDTTNQTDRVRIRYWVEEFTGSKGTRGRLYKQRDILGRGGKILSKPITGNKDVMADYIEDLQFLDDSKQPYIWLLGRASFRSYYPGGLTKLSGSYSDYVVKTEDRRYLEKFKQGLAVDSKRDRAYTVGTPESAHIHDLTIEPSDRYMSSYIGKLKRAGGDSVAVSRDDGNIYIGYRSSNIVQRFDPSTKKITMSINTRYSGVSDIGVSPDGYVYISPTTGDRVIDVYHPVSGSLVNTINFGGFLSKPFGLQFDFHNNLLYVTGSDLVYVYDYKSGSIVDRISLTHVNGEERNVFYGVHSMCIGSDNYMYISRGGEVIHIVDLDKTKKVGDSYEGHKWKSWMLVKDIACEKAEKLDYVLIEIDLILRTKQQYGRNKNYKKKKYFGGNYQIDKTDGYKRDEFSTSVLVRNLSL